MYIVKRAAIASNSDERLCLRMFLWEYRCRSIPTRVSVGNPGVAICLGGLVEFNSGNKVSLLEVKST
jgi:hypothetical protein